MNETPCICNKKNYDKIKQNRPKFQEKLPYIGLKFNKAPSLKKKTVKNPKPSKF